MIYECYYSDFSTEFGQMSHLKSALVQIEPLHLFACVFKVYVIPLMNCNRLYISYVCWIK